MWHAGMWMWRDGVALVMAFGINSATPFALLAWSGIAWKLTLVKLGILPSTQFRGSVSGTSTELPSWKRDTIIVLEQSSTYEGAKTSQDDEAFPTTISAVEISQHVAGRTQKITPKQRMCLNNNIYFTTTPIRTIGTEKRLRRGRLPLLFPFFVSFF